MSRTKQFIRVPPERVRRENKREASVPDVDDLPPESIRALDAFAAVANGPMEKQATRVGAGRMHSVQRHALLARIAHVQGNHHVQRIVSSLERAESNAGERQAQDDVLSPPVLMHVPTGPVLRQVEEEGRTGAGTLEGPVVDATARTADLEQGQTNEQGEQDGALTSDILPRIFVNGGKTGTGIVHWVGGNGGLGQQSVGAIDVVAPVYESAEAPSAVSGALSGALVGGLLGGAVGSLLGPAGAIAGGLLGGLTGGLLGGLHGARERAASGPNARAWIRPGTGRLTVTRSYRGALVGANGPTAYATARAATRVDTHEMLHVNSSRSIHNTVIQPLEQRIAQHTGQANALVSGGTTREEAERELQSLIQWNETIDTFRAADTSANTPMGTVDAADLGSGTYVMDYGPRKVEGVNYAHYYDTPPGPPAVMPAGR